MSSRSSNKNRKGSRGSSHSSSVVTVWSEWEWNNERQQWQSHRRNDRGNTEWQYKSGQSKPGRSAGSVVPRSDDSLPLDTVREDTTPYSINQNCSYTTGNKAVEALAHSLATTTLASQANPDPPIAGKLGKHNTSTEHQNFDQHYQVQDGRDFKFGRVFKVLWSEPSGSARGGTVWSKREKHGEEIFAKVRRFVIIDHRQGHCLCLPIMSYEGRATAKSGIHAQEHAIIHTTPVPRSIPDEDGTRMIFSPVRMIADSSKHELDSASRINYAKVYTVEYNVKVWFIGHIDGDYESTVKEDYNRANPPLSLSPQTSTSTSYRTDSSRHRGSSYDTRGPASNTPGYPTSSNYPTTPSYGTAMSQSTPRYSLIHGSGSSSAYGAYGSARQNPSTQYPPSSYPSSQYPPSQYPPSQYPPSQYPPSQYPPSQYPPSQHPPSQHPSSQHPSSQHPSSQHPSSQYPPSQHPPSQHPPSQYSSSQYPPPQYGTSQHPAYAPSSNQQYDYDTESKYGPGRGRGQ